MTETEFVNFTLAAFNAIGDMISPKEAGDAWQRAFTDYKRAPPADLTEGWALRSDSLKSRAMHYFRNGRSLCVKQWPQSRVALYAAPSGIVCPECLSGVRKDHA